MVARRCAANGQAVRDATELNVAIDHDTVDQLLGIGAIASPVVAGLFVFLVERLSRGRDGHFAELAKQGDQVKKHTTEIRHLQHSTHTEPFDDNWDKSHDR